MAVSALGRAWCGYGGYCDRACQPGVRADCAGRHWGATARGGRADGFGFVMAKMVKKRDLPVKDCACCGRPFVWRKAWAKVWDEVKYCSDKCRGIGVRK